MFVRREHKYIIVDRLSGPLYSLPARIFPPLIVQEHTLPAGMLQYRHKLVPPVCRVVAGKTTHFPIEGWPCGKNNASHGLLPLGFLRRVAEKKTDNNERKKVEEIDEPGARGEQDNSEYRHTKGDEELFCKECCFSPGEFRFEQGRV
jgi:hypothetical protein